MGSSNEMSFVTSFFFLASFKGHILLLNEHVIMGQIFYLSVARKLIMSYYTHLLHVDLDHTPTMICRESYISQVCIVMSFSMCIF